MTRKKSDGWKGIQHSRIRYDVQKSPAWKAISRDARALYIDLRGFLRSNNNGDISASLATLDEFGYKRTTLAVYLRELEAAGFIAKTRAGGVSVGSKVCSLYRFTDMPCNAHNDKGIEAAHATMDYALKFRGLTSNPRDIRAIQLRISAELSEAKAIGAAKQKPANKKIDGSESELVESAEYADR